MGTAVSSSIYYDGPVTETDRAQNMAGAPLYGVYGPNDFKVTAHPSIPFAVLVKAGKAHGHGVTDILTADAVVQCATLAVGQIRWDMIVVRRNWQPSLGGPSTLEYVQAGALPAIPSTRKVGPGVEDDQPLFFVKWQGGTTAPVDFVDARVWAGNGGLYAQNDIVRTYLDQVGTQVNINGLDWKLRLGDNDMPAWEGGIRHTEFTGVTNNAVTANTLWGPGALTKDTARSKADAASAGPGNDTFTLAGPAVYSLWGRFRLDGAAAGQTYISFTDANGVEIDSMDIAPGNPGGTYQHSNFYVPATASYKLRFFTGASGRKLDARIAITRTA